MGIGEMLEGLKYVLDHYGIQAAIIAYFLARDVYRDLKQDRVINTLQNEMRSVILPIVTRNAEVITANTIAHTESTHTVRECQHTLQSVHLLLKATGR